MFKMLVQVLLVLCAAINFAFAAVDINTAAESELDTLPGIGPAKAKLIVEDRKKNGPFKTAEDLKRVKGIGDKIFEKLKGQITVGGGTPAAVPGKTTDTKPAEGKTATKADAKPTAAADKKANTK
jgi:competence protein ComEA